VKKNAMFIAFIFTLQSTLSSLSYGQITTNSDLFPLQPITNPTTGEGGGGEEPIIIDETEPGLDFNNGGGGNNFFPVNPFPNPGRPGGGFGYDSNNGNNYAGSPVTGNSIRTAVVPGQYSCPLFENNSYQDLNFAIASLTNAIQNVADECQSSQPSIAGIQQTNEEVRAAVQTLQGFVAEPQTGYANTKGLQESVTKVVTGIDRLTDVFRNSTSLTKACGRKDLSWGKVALELNNVVNSASPFLLLLLASNPALALTVKGTIMGTIVASNAVTAMSEVIAANTIDMTIPENRNAVLQNTCQFTKVARKVKYIQLAQTRKFDVLNRELNENINTLATQLQVVGGLNSFDSNLYNTRGTIRNNIGAIQARVRADKEAVDEIYQRIQTANNDPYLTCYEGKVLADLVSTNDNSFPDSVSNGILDAYDQNNYLKNIDLTDFELGFGGRRDSQDEADRILKAKVLSLIGRYQQLKVATSSFPSPPTTETVAACAATTMAFIGQIRVMINETTKIMVNDLDKFENELSQDPEYIKWKERFEKISVERENTSRMARVLRELTSGGGASYNRSEFNEAANRLKRSLMGERNLYFVFKGNSPVFAWLDYKYTEYARAKGRFDQSMQDIFNKALYITRTGRGIYPKGSSLQQNKQILEDLKLVDSLKIINKQTIPAGSKQHEHVCIDLEKAVKDYSESLDHLSATSFMCDMVYEHLDNSADARIKQFCQGNINYTGQQSQKQKSVLERATMAFDAKPSAKSLSPNQKYDLLTKKMVEIGCRLPTAAEVGGL